MGVIQYPMPIPMTVGNNPNLRFMITTDNDTTTTTAGYLNSTVAESATPLSNSDIIFALTSFNTTTRTGTFGIYTVVINTATGSIKLNAYSVPGGNVRLPVTVGDFAVFTNTDGQIGDDGYLPSNASLTRVAMANITTPHAPVAGDFVNFADTTGTVANYNYVPSNAANNTVVMYNGSAPVNGDIAAFHGTDGTITDSNLNTSNIVFNNINNTILFGASIIFTKAGGLESGGAVTTLGQCGVIQTSSLTTAAGGNYQITWTNTLFTAGSVCILQSQGGTSTTRTLLMDFVPSSGTATLTLYNISPTSAFNGNFLLGYLIV